MDERVVAKSASSDGGDLTAVEPLDAVAVVVEGAGSSGRRMRELLASLTEGPWPFEELIRRSALPRRSVEAVLTAAKGDLDERAGRFSIRSDRAAAYRDRFGLATLRASRLDDPVGRRLAEQGTLVARIEGDIAAVPVARKDLDHVPATAETVARRALWLDGTFDLAGRRLLCVGDHDLTSLAIGAVNPEVEVMVVDIDERLLEFIDGVAVSRGLQVRCLYGDFRFGLPEEAVQWADVVLTDPPYTPEGVQLFLGRGLEGLRDRAGGRLVMAYGFSELAPGLGVKVQRAVLDLGLAFEAIWPAFNRYHGAQAVGSASDLYVCQPTVQTWKVLERQVAQAAVNIYTHGQQSLEGSPKQSTATEAEILQRVALGDLDDQTRVIAVNASPQSRHRVELSTVLGGGLPKQWVKKPPVVATADLSADPGSWLLRLLLAANADRLAVLLPNEHPDLASQETQRALSDLVGAKYSLRFRRSSPTPASTVVEAIAVPAENLAGGAQLVRRLLERAHGKVTNVWRDGLIDLSRRGDAVLTKNEARALVQDTAARLEVMSSRLIDLPRHQLSDLLAQAAASTEQLSNTLG